MIGEHRLLWACALAGLACIALGSEATATSALASAAGSAFEAAPFLLAAPFLTRVLGPRLGGLASLGGCGCAGGAIPGALSLPALALCALGFGPLPTLVRALVALRLAVRRHGRDRTRHEAPADLFVDLERLGACAFLASLSANALATAAPAIPGPLAFAAGLGLGVLAPCATAGVAIAAAFAHATPGAAYGILCTTGMLTLWKNGLIEPPIAGTSPERKARLSGLLLACALAFIAVRGPSGLVNPRLLVPIGIGAMFAFAGVARARSRSGASALVPLLMLGSLVAVPRPPDDRADATRLDDAFAGEHLNFIGVASTGRGSGTTLTRYAITCCRLDATPVSVRLDRRLAAAFAGRWVATTGTLVNAGAAGLELHPERLRAIAAPADPFIYR